MKDYYQRKGDGFNLDPVVYRKTRSEIRCYNFYTHLCEIVDSKSPSKVTHDDIANKISAELKIAAIEKALQNYVPAEYQKAVWEHTVNEVEYEDLENKYYISQSTMKKYTQHFVFGVARCLGEDYTNVN